MKLTQNELMIYLQQGREIEFSLNSKEYFLEPNYDSTLEYQYILFDCEKNTNIFCGCLDDLLDYEFNDFSTFRNNMDNFCFDYIL